MPRLRPAFPARLQRAGARSRARRWAAGTRRGVLEAIQKRRAELWAGRQAGPSPRRGLQPAVAGAGRASSGVEQVGAASGGSRAATCWRRGAPPPAEGGQRREYLCAGAAQGSWMLAARGRMLGRGSTWRGAAARGGGKAKQEEGA